MTVPKPKSPEDQSSDVNLAEAENVIYIDVEGFKDKAQLLIGVLLDDTTHSIVLDQKLSLHSI